MELTNNNRLIRRNGEQQSETFNSLLAGSAAGCTTCLIFHPLDVLRTKIQSTTVITVEKEASVILSSVVTSQPSGTLNSTSGPISVFSHTIRNGGFIALYTGLSLPLAAQALYKATIMTVNKISKEALVRTRTNNSSEGINTLPYQLTMTDHFLCGSSSGAINAFLFVAPVEFVRNQQVAMHTKNAQERALSSMSDSAKFKAKGIEGPIDIIKNTVKKHGYARLWRGGGVTLVRDSIGCGSFFLMFETGQKYLPSITGKEKGSFLNTIGSGFMVCGCGHVVVFVFQSLDFLTLTQSSSFLLM